MWDIQSDKMMEKLMKETTLKEKSSAAKLKKSVSQKESM
jgi:hypothetical protein